jgi:hypothetical protein
VTRHVLVDSSGIPVAAVVTATDVQDRHAFPQLLRRAKRVARPSPAFGVDKGYTGTTVAKPGITVDMVSGLKAGSGSLFNRDGEQSNAPTDGSTTAVGSTVCKVRSASRNRNTYGLQVP